MIEINVKTDFDKIIRKLDATKKAVEKAQVSALNKAAAQSRTLMLRAITSSYKLPASFVRDRLRVKRAVRNGAYAFSASLIGSGKRSMNMIAFASERISGAEKKAWRKETSKTGRLYGPQLPFEIKRGGGRVYVNGAFVGNEGRTVFRRKGKERLPIEALRTISVPSMFNTKKNTGEITGWLRVNLPRIFESELKFYMAREVKLGY